MGNSNSSNAIMLLDLVLAGFAITAEIGELFRLAESEGRNVSPEELQELRDENAELNEGVMAKLQAKIDA